MSLKRSTVKTFLPGEHSKLPPLPHTQTAAARATLALPGRRLHLARKDRTCLIPTSDFLRVCPLPCTLSVLVPLCRSCPLPRLGALFLDDICTQSLLPCCTQFVKEDADCEAHNKLRLVN